MTPVAGRPAPTTTGPVFPAILCHYNPSLAGMVGEAALPLPKAQTPVIAQAQHLHARKTLERPVRSGAEGARGVVRQRLQTLRQKNRGAPDVSTRHRGPLP